MRLIALFVEVTGKHLVGVFCSPIQNRVNTNCKWRKKNFIRVYMKQCCLSLTFRIMQPLSNPINIFKINANIILYHVFQENIKKYSKYHQHHDYQNQMKIHRHFESSLETLHRPNGAAFISKSFALNLQISVPLTNI